jgi:cob(I)alamin adenosyltransferase
MPIYTRTGDSGLTSLFGGKRVLKCEELVDVYGSIDELNSWVGLLNAQSKTYSFSKVQSDLLIIGSSLAGGKIDLTPLTSRITEMEREIDRMDKTLPKLSNFILPGGSVLAAQIHIARSVCRRVERQAVAVSQKEHIDSVIVKYLNRLSDLLFTYARFINMQGNIKEIVWSGISRKKLTK